MINEIKLILKAQKWYYKYVCGKWETDKKRIHYQKKIDEIIAMFENSNEHGIVALLTYNQYRDAIFLLKSQNDPDYEHLYKLNA